MPRGVVIVAGVALFAGVAYMWWKNRAGAQPAGTSSAVDTSGIDYGGELSTLQSEYGNLASEISAMQGSPGAPSGSPPGSPPPGRPAGPPGPANVPPFRPPVRIRPKPPVRRRKWVPARIIKVQRGQTLLSLSRQYLHTGNRAQLAHANKLGTGAGLHEGQRLIIPGHYEAA